MRDDVAGLQREFDALVAEVKNVPGYGDDSAISTLLGNSDEASRRDLRSVRAGTEAALQSAVTQLQTVLNARRNKRSRSPTVSRAGPPDGSAASKAAACGGQPGGRPAWNAGPGARTPTMTPRKLAGVGAPPSAQLAVGGGSASPGATVETLAEARRRAACAENDARVLRRVAADLEDDNRRLRWEKARLQVLAMDSMRDGVEPVGRDTSFEPPLRTPPRAAARPPVTAEPTRASVTRSAARSPSAIAAQRGSTATTPRARDRTAASTAAAQLASPPAPSQRVAEE